MTDQPFFIEPYRGRHMVRDHRFTYGNGTQARPINVRLFDTQEEAIAYIAKRLREIECLVDTA